MDRPAFKISSAWRWVSAWGRFVHALGGVDPGVWILAAALFGCGAYYMWQVRPLEEQVVQVTRQASALNRVPVSRKLDGDDPAMQLAAFYDSFPRIGDSPNAMQTLYDAAQAEGLVLERGDYRLVRERGERYVRYEISLPVKAAYPQLRRFLSNALAALPTLAVDEVQFTRAQIADALVECRLSLSLYLVDNDRVM
ncbi:MAG: hypothetical protein HY066_04620 [Betaproteobacteria bacterium]|nr:hypothetical protein [Betaproteobacteria bacterium]